MYHLPLQLNPQECIECVEKGLKGDWTSAIACTITLAVTAIIRHFEKKHIKNKHNQER